MALNTLAADLEVELTRLNRLVGDLQAKLDEAVLKRDDLQADLDMINQMAVQQLAAKQVL